MKTTLKTLLVAAGIVAFAVAAGDAQLTPARDLTLAKESRLWLDGTSTTRSYTCTAAKVEVSVSAEVGAAPSDLVKSASLVVPVASLDCKNETMNGHMRKALKATENPQISWRMSSYTVQGTAVAMQGKLSIAGKENPFELSGTGTVENGVVRLKGSKKFKMTEFGVKPPKLFLGAMKVGDPVTVSFDLVLNP